MNIYKDVQMRNDFIKFYLHGYSAQILFAFNGKGDINYTSLGPLEC